MGTLCEVCGDKAPEKGRRKCSACRKKGQRTLVKKGSQWVESSQPDITVKGMGLKKEDPPEESPDEATKQAIVAFNAYDVKHPVWRSVGRNGYWVYAGRHHIGNEGLISSCLNPDCSTTLLEGEAHAMKVPGQPETPKLPIPLSL